MKRKLLWFAPLAILGVAALIALGGWVVMLLWNWLLPALFGWPHIAFWQALGLLALCRILFGGVGRGHGPGRHGRHRGMRRMAERWKGLSPEERERFWREFHDKGSAPRPQPETGSTE